MGKNGLLSNAFISRNPDIGRCFTLRAAKMTKRTTNSLFCASFVIKMDDKNNSSSLHILISIFLLHVVEKLSAMTNLNVSTYIANVLRHKGRCQS